MKRINALILALALGIAVVAGTFAALRTSQLGRATSAVPRATAAQIARQNRALSRAEAALRAELRRRPPALAPTSAAAPAPAQTVIYRRPPAIVHVVHRHGEHELEAEGRGGGEGLDD